jgi:hypothetical protein
LYNIEFVNKTFESIPLQLKVKSPLAAVITRADGNAIMVPAEGMLKAVCFIKIPAKEIKSARTIVTVGIYSGEKLIEEIEIKFIGPVSKSSDMKSRREDEQQRGEEEDSVENK